MRERLALWLHHLAFRSQNFTDWLTKRSDLLLRPMQPATLADEQPMPAEVYVGKGQHKRTPGDHAWGNALDYEPITPEEPITTSFELAEILHKKQPRGDTPMPGTVMRPYPGKGPQE